MKYCKNLIDGSKCEDDWPSPPILQSSTQSSDPFSSSASKQSKRALCEEKQLSGYKANSESHFGVLDDAQRRDFNDVSYSTFTLMVPTLFLN